MIGVTNHSEELPGLPILWHRLDCKELAYWDLKSKLVPYWDPHIVFSLIGTPIVVIVMLGRFGPVRPTGGTLRGFWAYRSPGPLHMPGFFRPNIPATP